jgi:hypothetical protein
MDEADCMSKQIQCVQLICDILMMLCECCVNNDIPVVQFFIKFDA